MTIKLSSAQLEPPQVSPGLHGPQVSNESGERESTIELTLKDLESFRRHRLLSQRYLPFLKTLTDFDITSEVGYHELTGTPLTVKHLLLLDLAPPVTVFRRLNRLCSLGIIVRTRASRDRRVHELRLTPAVHQLFAIYSNMSRR